MKKIVNLILGLIIILTINSCSTKESGDLSFSNLSGVKGQGGSLARFCIAENYLYIVDNTNLHIFNISQPSKPVKVSEKNIGFGIETIFYYQNHLYIGSNSGMVICSLTDPTNPSVLSTYSHIFSCDPVVVQGNIAYITLRTGTTCARGLNQLEVIDISNKSNPQLIKTIPMSNPWGLGVDGKHLFVCEKGEDLAYLDISNPTNPILKKTFQDIFAYDLIPSNNLLITTGKEGIKQFDYSKLPDSLVLLSKIEIGK
ncbi:MAG: hypothetical protein HUU47_06880 [Bacteroidetes bacterium]|nr:hypothetical protein [Bacteroidota bacterium]